MMRFLVGALFVLLLASCDDGSYGGYESLEELVKEEGPDVVVSCNYSSTDLTAGECLSLKKQIDNLVDGKGNLEAPDTMNRGDTKSVVLLIEPKVRDSDEVAVPESAFAPEEDYSDRPDMVRQYGEFDLKIGRRMKASLYAGPGIEVEPEEAIEQDLGAGRRARWQWDITANESGNHPITAVVNVEGVGSNGTTIPLRMFDTEKTINVSVTATDRIDDTANWIGDRFATLEKALASMAAMLAALLAVIFGVNKVRSAMRNRNAHSEEDLRSKDRSEETD